MDIKHLAALLFSSSLSILIFWIFKVMGQKQIKALPVIVVNYLVCFLLGNTILLEQNLFFAGSFANEGALSIFSLGILFMATFLLMAESTKISGASLSAVASKMSMLIPVLSSFVLFREELKFTMAIGLLMALISVALITYNGDGDVRFSWLLIAVFLGSGMVDLGMNTVKHMDYKGWSNLQFTTMTFTGAAVTGLTYMAVKAVVSNERIIMSKTEWIYGGILGTINLFSIFAIYLALDVFQGRTSVFFTVNNVLVVLGSVLVGLFYKEGFDRRKTWGLIAAFIALLLLK